MEILSFIAEIPEAPELIKRIDWTTDSNLKDLMFLILDEGSLELFIKVYQNFQKTNIKFTQRPITELKKLYVLNHMSENPERLARILGVDTRTIYSWKAEMK